MWFGKVDRVVDIGGSMPELITQAEYARRRGCSREAVSKAIESGRISAVGTDKLIDPAVADIQWERNTRTRANAKADTGSSAAQGDSARGEADKGDSAQRGTGDERYMTARSRRETAEADAAEMKTAELQGLLVRREHVDRAFYEIAREMRDGLMTCARRIAAEVAGLDTAEACEAVIAREHQLMLEVQSSAFREKLGASPDSLAVRPLAQPKQQATSAEPEGVKT